MPPRNRFDLSLLALLTLLLISCGGGSGDSSTRASVPNAPSDLLATAVSATQIDLSWRDNSSDELWFQVERSSDGLSFSSLGFIGANTTTFSDTGLASSSTYFYRILANNKAGNSAYAATVTATTLANASAPPKLISLTPASSSINVNGVVTFTVLLDSAAPAGGTVVTLSTDAGSVASTVAVSPGQTSADFQYTAASVAGSANITATLATTTLIATVNITSPAPNHLVINEIDYDQVGTDSSEFVEIHNPTASAIDMTGTALVFINGATNTEYLRVALDSAGVLGAGQYLVVATPTVAVAPGATVINFSLVSANVQNGNPDAIGLVNVASSQLIDAISYGGAITTGTVNAIGTFNFTEGTALVAVDSNTLDGALARQPNGQDTDDANTDWAFLPTPTPGAANL